MPNMVVFASLPFLYAFLPLCVAFYFIVPGRRAKNITLTIFSLLFYAWGEPIYWVLLVISSLQDYICGRVIGARAGKPAAKAALVVSLVGNLGLLFTFKYLDFALRNLGLLIGQPMPVLGLVMPIGISFYTFQTLSYTIDVYKGKIQVQRDFLTFLMYVSSFPQLIAGPIVRYAEVSDQLAARRETLRGTAEGAARFFVGLSKKVLIANYAGRTATLFLADPGIISVGEAWIGILFFAFQIYFDFSGYSDMAIGMGKVFGFTFPENFRYPYCALSITECWRRWHMTLSRFFRDYVYIPLGGNRRLQARNILITWFLTGLWHGASWNFVLWGLYYAALLIVEKYLLASVLQRWKPLAAIYRLAGILIGWGLFYFTDFGEMLSFFQAMFFARPLWREGVGYQLVNNIPLLLLCCAASTPLAAHLGRKLREAADPEDGTTTRKAHALYGVALTTLCVLALVLCTASLVTMDYNPFIYFRF
jgi:alginate O-acetyltransferase complex protein AlgI